MSILDRLFKHENTTMAKTTGFTKDDAAKMLSVSPEALAAFEKAYQTQVLDKPVESDNLFDRNAAMAIASRTDQQAVCQDTGLQNRLESIKQAIINELLEQTKVLVYDGQNLTTQEFKPAISQAPVDLTEITRLPKELQPQLTGRYIQRDIDDETGLTLLQNYRNYLTAKTPKEKAQWYNLFRQGLDILDLDPITYAILSRNQNSAGNWFPGLVNAVQKQDFFKVPATKIMKVPLPLLQLSRLEYQNLTRTTVNILDRFCFTAFDLDETQEYFIKTGTYSSKFEFRNAHIHEPKEVRELGEYLLFIQHQASQMAAPLSTPSIYGISTTNEWLVRDYIPNSENLPTIYKGLPLRTEYRIFVDLDRLTILSSNPYWDPDVMLKRFGHENDADSPHQIHDYTIYKSQADRLQKTYDANIGNLKARLQPMLKDMGLTGQWSIDIMQDGQDFYIIDMALAQNSAFNETIPPHLRRISSEDWLPRINA